jgi:cytosine/adenosine deaminase-related metal-dependent hydrolase
VHVQADGLETLDPVRPGRRLGEVAAQVSAGAERGDAARERVADIDVLGIHGGQLVELRLALRLVQVARDQQADPVGVGSDEDFCECFNMITSRPAALLNLARYGVEPGQPADLVVFDATSRRDAVAALSPLLLAFKRGVRTVTSPAVQVHRPR